MINENAIETNHGFRMVGGNGAFIYENNHITVSGFEPHILQSLLHLIEEYRLAYLVDGRWDYSFTGETSHPIFRNLDSLQLATNLPLAELDGIVKIVLFTKSLHIDDLVKSMDVTVHTHGDEGILDISPSGIQKWSGLQALGLTAGNYIAFGNDTNDISMFNYARESICVGDNELAKVHATQFTSAKEIAQTIRSVSKAY